MWWLDFIEQADEEEGVELEPEVLVVRNDLNPGDSDHALVPGVLQETPDIAEPELVGVVRHDVDANG